MSQARTLGPKRPTLCTHLTGLWNATLESRDTQILRSHASTNLSQRVSEAEVKEGSDCCQTGNLSCVIAGRLFSDIAVCLKPVQIQETD